MDMHDMQSQGRDDYLTPREVAALLPRTSAESVRRWIQRGDLEAVRNPSGRYLVPRHAAERALRAVVAPAGRATAPSAEESGGPSPLPGQEALL